MGPRLLWPTLVQQKEVPNNRGGKTKRRRQRRRHTRSRCRPADVAALCVTSSTASVRSATEERDPPPSRPCQPHDLHQPGSLRGVGGSCPPTSGGRPPPFADRGARRHEGPKHISGSGYPRATVCDSGGAAPAKQHCRTRPQAYPHKPPKSARACHDTGDSGTRPASPSTGPPNSSAPPAFHAPLLPMGWARRS